MASRGSSQFRAWICLITYLFTGIVTGGRGLVLCTGPDGHLALECAKIGNCSGCEDDEDTVATNSATRTSAVVATESCPCIDISLAFVSDCVTRNQVRPKSTCEPPLAALPQSPCALRLPPSVRWHGLTRVRTPPRANDSALRTIVLLV